MAEQRSTRKVARTDTRTPAKRVVAVDVTGLPMAAVVVPASAHENVATAVLMDQLTAVGCADRLEVLLVDRGTSVRAAASIGKAHGIEVRRIGWDDKQPVFRPIALAWRVEVAHGCHRVREASASLPPPQNRPVPEAGEIV